MKKVSSWWFIIIQATINTLTVLTELMSANSNKPTILEKCIMGFGSLQASYSGFRIRSIRGGWKVGSLNEKMKTLDSCEFNN